MSIRAAYRLLGKVNTARVLLSGNPVRIMRHVARTRAMRVTSKASVGLWPKAKKGKRK